jgi:predicted RNA-binding protein YlqC (UPF0109 family)
MKNLLEFILIHLVDHPEDVRVEESQQERATSYILHVHPDDMGKVIGKNGSVINSIRNIAKIRAIKEGIRPYINLAEPDEQKEQTETNGQDQLNNGNKPDEQAQPNKQVGSESESENQSESQQVESHSESQESEPEN